MSLILRVTTKRIPFCLKSFQDSDSVGSGSPEHGPQRRTATKPQLIKQHSDLMAESRDIVNQTGPLSPALRDSSATGLMLSGTGRHRSASSKSGEKQKVFLETEKELFMMIPDSTLAHVKLMISNALYF